MVAFTNGQLIGTGTSEIVGTPEPATQGLVGLILSGLAVAIWRRGRFRVERRSRNCYQSEGIESPLRKATVSAERVTR